MSFFSVKYPSSLQVELWLLKRNELNGREIAEKKGISRATVSKNLKHANNRVKSLLQNAAQMNKIHLDLLNEKLGYARGYNHIFKLQVHITYSPVNGIHVWYDHKGVCENCEDFVSCRKVLLQEFQERNLQVPHTAIRPTDLSDLLFQQIEASLT